MTYIPLLIDWYKRNKRNLPWRNDKNPYSVWLSEVILQQTRVNQGLSYFNRFLDNFKSIHALAEADEQLVLNLWQGLGYYTRARNLHKTAQIISTQYKGVFPDNYIELKKLPGVGPYTAAAIASICFNEKVPAIDGNAYRVYARFFGLDKDISDSNAHRFFFDFAIDLMPRDNPGDFNEAIMELGATICKPQNPICDACPIVGECVAYETGNVDRFPIKTKKIKVKKRYLHYILVTSKNRNKFLVKKRTQKDVWHNLFDFPLIETNSSKLNQKDTTIPITSLYKVGEIKHILTHQCLFISFYMYNGDIENFRKFSLLDYLIINQEQIIDMPFPKPIASFLKDIFPDMVQ